jgi:BASS family bile acid:Na+ symporter
LRSRALGLLSNSSFIFLLAMVLALAYGEGANSVQHAMVPVLALIMTVSITDISTRIFLDWKRILIPVALTIVLSYGVATATYVGLSRLLLSDPALRTGFVLVAAVPPAVAVIPFGYLLGANMRTSLIGNVGAYVAGFAISPLICIGLLGSNFIEPSRLLIVLGELIVAPLVVSRILRRTPLTASVARWRGPVVNWGFFLVIYIIVGLNRDVFLHEPGTLALVAAIAFIGLFVFPEVINGIGMLLGVRPADRISYMLLASRKNVGMAAAIALLFFEPRAAMPAAVINAVAILNLIWLSWWAKRMSH